MQPSLTVWQWKRVHLLNGICGLTIGIYIGYVLLFMNSPDYPTFRICLYGIFLNLPPLVLNHYHRYAASAYYIVLMTTILCSFIAIARRYDGVEYFLISNSVVVVLFFRRFWKVALLFAVNMGAYFAVRHAMAVVKPFLYVPNTMYFYNVNLVLVFMTLFFVVYYFRSENFRQEKLLTLQNESLEKSLAHLRNPQTQLVQQEKLASLGALTAGIAHEIQNPLNFVDNFAEVGIELVEEFKTELAQEPLSEKGKLGVGRLLGDLSLEPAKGERARRPRQQHRKGHAAALAPQHRRAPAHRPHRAGGRIPAPGLPRTPRQAARLYRRPHHRFQPAPGPGARDGGGKGRVLLNLFNNAFCAVRRKAEQLLLGTYKPVVSVSTQRVENGVFIRVRDNGVGIPPEIIDKIFHPFFTTKPPGEGTGLGLSLSYDIVTKSHGGLLTVSSVAGQYSEFTVWLPVAPNP